MGIFDFFKKKKTELKGEEKPNKSEDSKPKEEVKPSELDASSPSESLEGKTIVITGVFENHSRDELKKMIESKGGKASSSVSKNTAFILSGSNMGPKKKHQAEELDIKIISEDEFIKQYISGAEKKLDVETEKNKEIIRTYDHDGNLITECPATKVKCQACDGSGKSPGKTYCIQSCESGYETNLNGLFKEWFANGRLRKKCNYENDICLFLEEYHLNGTMVRKGGYEVYKTEYGTDTRETGVWEYFDAKNGQKINKEDYVSKWYENLPDEFKYFEDKEEDEEGGVEKFWQVCDYNVIVYKNEKVIAEGYIEFDLYENIWLNEDQGYDREADGAVLIIDGKQVDHDDFDNVELITERETERYCDSDYASDAFEMFINSMTSK